MTSAMQFKVAAACRDMRNLGAELGRVVPAAELTDAQGAALANLIRSHTDLLAQFRNGLDGNRKKVAKRKG